MKLLIFAKHVDGGTGSFVEQLQKLTKHLPSPTIKTIILEAPQYRSMDMNNNPVSYFSNSQVLPYYYRFSISGLLNIVRELKFLYNECSTFDPDLIISIDNHCNVLVCTAKKLRLIQQKTRLLLTVHNNISAVTFAKLSTISRIIFKSICHVLFLKADEIVCVSNGVALDVQAFFSLQRRPIVIYYGVHSQTIQRLAALPIEKKDMRTMKLSKGKILSIGRFAPQKDFKTLIEAFSLFAKQDKKTDLYIIGDGPDRASIVTQIHQHNLDNRVHLLGWKQNVYPYIKAADVFVLSSNYEGFPYVLLEAAALGKPIIATDTPYGPNELLENNQLGMLVPTHNTQSLSRAFTQMTSASLRISFRNNFSKRKHSFTEHAMLCSYTSLILQIVNTRVKMG